MKHENLIKRYFRELVGFILDKEFLAKIKLTLLMLVIYRFIAFIPIPGVDLEVYTEEFFTLKFGVTSLFYSFDRFTGGALKRMSVMSLGISPYITSSLFFSFAPHAIPYFASLKKEGALGRQKINDYTKILAFFMSFFQGVAFAFYLQFNGLARFPGAFFVFQTAFLLASATMIVIWFSDQISTRGVGSGSSIIIYSNIVSLIPSSLSVLWKKFWANEIPVTKLCFFLLLSCFLLFFVTFCERVYKTIKAQSLNNRKALLQGLPENLVYMKLNPAGIFPSIGAGMFMTALTSVDYIANFSRYEWGAWILASLAPGCYLYILLHAVFIFFTSYVYAEILFNPEETAKRFRNDSIISGKVPGKSTQAFLEEKLFYVATLGGVYLVLVCCLPELFFTSQDQSFYIHGTSYVIVVGVATDLLDKISAGIYSRFIEKSMKAIRKGYF